MHVLCLSADKCLVSLTKLLGSGLFRSASVIGFAIQNPSFVFAHEAATYTPNPLLSRNTKTFGSVLPCAECPVIAKPDWIGS